MGKRLVILLLLVLVLGGVGNGTAIAAESKRWEIPRFGTFEVPGDMKIAVISDLRQFLEEQKAKVAPTAAANLDEQAEMAKQLTDVGIFQLSKPDGDTYRQAWVVALWLKEPLPKLTPFVAGPPDDKKRQDLRAFYAGMQKEFGSFAYYDPQQQVGIKVVALPEPELYALGSDSVIAGQVRFLAEAQGFLFPLSANAYVTQNGGKPVVLLLATVDSERPYWTHFMRGLLKG